jgi:hypothetical protein
VGEGDQVREDQTGVRPLEGLLSFHGSAECKYSAASNDIRASATRRIGKSSDPGKLAGSRIILLFSTGWDR